MTPFPCISDLRDRVETTAEMVSNARRKVERFKKSPQAPHDPEILARAHADLRRCETLHRAARAELGRFQ